jgi:lipid-A-disaccharide synthase
MNYYLIAGEASGDLHGANLMKALRAEDPGARFRVWGGDLMEAQGGELVKHYRDLAFMGFAEVVANLRTILRNIRFCKEDILAWQPDVLILIDYPGFNLRIARWARAQGLRIFYYISPQIWAWHRSRVHQIKANVDRMYVILPFEEDFYREYGLEVDFVGHPLLDVIDRYEADPAFRSEYGLDERPVVALLPGSRRQEISRMLPTMLRVPPDFPDLQFVIAGAPSVPEDFYRHIIEQSPAGQQQVAIVHNRTYPLLAQAYAALVTSGTATLETGLFAVPEVVCYKGSALSYLIARRLVDIPYISLVNLVVDRQLLTELIQDDFNPARLKAELQRLLDPAVRAELREGFGELRRRLGEAGASRWAARLMVERLRAMAVA